MPLADRDEAYRADLYMVNSAVAVVLADAADGIGAVTGIVDGMATGFAVNDSTFSFDRGQATRMEGMQSPGYHTLYAVTMPSRDAMAAAADGLWQVKVYVDLGGKITENVLHISEPLRAGRVKIIKGVIKDDGSITTESPEVGARSGRQRNARLEARRQPRRGNLKEAPKAHSQPPRGEAPVRLSPSSFSSLN